MAITPITSWRKTVYIAKLLSVSKVNGDQTPVYDTPKPFIVNTREFSGQAKIDEFGANTKKMYKGLIRATGLDVNEFDVAYLDGVTPVGEAKNGFNANYIIRRVVVPNITTMIYFESIKGR
jgi:hypothetical protein